MADPVMAHRSRLGWSDPMDEVPASPPVHTHRLPMSVRAALIGLVAAVALLLVAVSLLGVYVYKQQQYIQGKGEQRDRENSQLQEQIRRAQCDLLDQLPEGGLLDRPRAKYGCGPGIPLSQLTPQEQAQLSGRTSPAAVPPSVQQPPAPGMGSAATPNPPRTPPGPVPPRTGPGPMSEPTPSLLDPITEPVCGLVDVCN